MTKTKQCDDYQSFFIKYLLRNTNVTEHMPRKRARGSSMAKQYTAITNQKRKSKDKK